MVVQIEIIPCVECGVPMQFEQRTMKMIGSCLGNCFDNSAAISAVLGAESLG